MRALLVSLFCLVAIWCAPHAAQAQAIVLPCVPSGNSCIPVSAANPLPTTGGGGSGLTVGTTTITSGTTNQLLYDNAGVLGEAATGNSGVLVTSAGGAPSISTTLPAGLTIPGYAPLASPTFTGSVLVPAGSACTAGNLGLGIGINTYGFWQGTNSLTVCVAGADKLDYGATVGGTWVFGAPINMGSNNIVGIAKATAFTFQAQGAAPAATGTCPVTAQTVGQSAGQFTMNGACIAGTVILAVGAASPPTTGFSCRATDETTPAILFNQTAKSTASVTFTVIGSTGASDIVTFSCMTF